MARLSLSVGLATMFVAHLNMAAAQNCQNLTVPVEVNALKATFALAAPGTNIDVTNFILELTRPGANYTKEVLQKEEVSSQFLKIEVTSDRVCSSQPHPFNTMSRQPIVNRPTDQEMLRRS